MYRSLGIGRENGGYMWWEPDEENPHLLIIGPSDSGKTHLTKCILDQLPEDAEIIAFTSNSSEYERTLGHRGYARVYPVSYFGEHYGHESIRSIVEEMEQEVEQLPDLDEDDFLFFVFDDIDDLYRAGLSGDEDDDREWTKTLMRFIHKISDNKGINMIYVARDVKNKPYYDISKPLSDISVFTGDEKELPKTYEVNYDGGYGHYKAFLCYDEDKEALQFTIPYDSDFEML